MFHQNLSLVVILLSQISGIWSAATRNESSIQYRIKGGTNADINNAKFVVSVEQREEDDSGYDCAGSLISNNVVLTAGHCLLVDIAARTYGNPKDYRVVMGNSDNEHPDQYTLKFNVKSFAKGDFKENFENDIALLFLDGSVPEDHPTAKPVILNDGPLKDGIMCQTYGWGDTGSGEYSTILQVVDLPLITFESCVAKTAYGVKVRRGMICAGDLEKGGIGSCEGDSGGPLVCGGIQVGVTTWGRDPCAQPFIPGVFTHVLEFRRWIRKQVHVHGGTQPKFARLKKKHNLHWEP